jgi:anionic cell wall polymer biosynthesis LytR-Cps2A-Psr (LCP) family protein
MALDLPQGHVHLDGNTAVRFARARGVEEMHDGHWIMQSEGDLGRIGRQQLLLSALATRFHTSHGPITILHAAMNVRSGVIVDSLFTSKDLRAVSKAILIPAPAVERCLCILPTKRQIPADEGASPFPPQHSGSSVLRVVDMPTASNLLRWFASPDIYQAPASSCSSEGR